MLVGQRMLPFEHVRDALQNHEAFTSSSSFAVSGANPFFERCP